MKNTEIAYIAGLFDGEGDVGNYPYRATKNGKYYPKLTARIHNSDGQVLKWVYSKLKYGLFCRDRIGIKKSGNPARKQMYVFIVTHRTARKFLKLVLPYIRIKKHKTIKVLADDYLYRNRKIGQGSSVG